METKSRGTIAPVIGELLSRPQAFDFFQAVRLLRRTHARSTPGRTSDEFVRFGAEPSLAFSSAQITSVEVIRDSLQEQNPEVIRVLLRVSFFGLIGASGVLPYHYTVETIRQQRDRETALLDFFDVLHTRLLHHFYLAWEKYQVPIHFESAREQAVEPAMDDFSVMLQSLMGLATAGQSNRSSIRTDAHLRYAAFFAQHRRNVTSMQQMLGEYYAIPVSVKQFQFQRLSIPEDDRSQLPIAMEFKNCNNQLGRDVVLGQSVWDCVGKFIVRFGPLDFDRYVQFIRDGEDYLSASYLIRLYVRSEFVFELQPVLKKEQIPFWELKRERAGVHRLGRTIWLKSVDAARDFDGSIYPSADGNR